MKNRSKWLPILFSALAVFALLAACGGDDDDSGDDDDDGGSGPFSSGKDDSKVSTKDVKIPAIKDGQFTSGTVHIEVSSGKDFKADLPGGGIVASGYTLLTFGNQEATLILAFQPNEEDELGSISLTTTEVVTGGAWGKECTVTADDGAKELKGSFECKDADALVPKSTKTEKVNIKGNFTATR